MTNILKKSVFPLVSILLISAGTFLLKEKHYTLISLLVAAAACFGFAVYFDRKDITSRYAVLVAVMTALSVAGRFVFAPVPAFKPVTAVVIISGMYLTAGGGFLTGALTALISNMYFGHGAWTPFQMIAWGMIGMTAGILSKQLRNKKIVLFIYGAFAGVFYSFVMDIWTVLWYSDGFEIELYKAALISAVPYTIIYAVSNVIFLSIIAKPFGRKLNRAVELIER